MENNDNDQMEISFLGMKLKCSKDPSNRAIIVIVLLLIFFVVLALLLPKLTIGTAAVKKCLSKMKWFSG
jgi:hypothetical protein